MLDASRLLVRVEKRDFGAVCNVIPVYQHEVDDFNDMAHRFGAETAMATAPEVDEIDGFKFVAFEELNEMGNYVRQTPYGCGATPLARYHYQGGSTKPKAGKTTSHTVAGTNNSSRLLVNRKLPKSGKPGACPPKDSGTATTALGKSKKSVLTRHKQRLRKSDKRVIDEKLYGFDFVSAFTLRDLDDYVDRKMASPLTSAVKRKASCDQVAMVSPNSTKKARENYDRAGLEASNPGLDGTSTLYKKATMSPLNKFGLDRLKKLNMSVLKPNFTQSKPLKPAAHGGSQQVPRKVKKNLAGSSSGSARKTKRHPHMQIDTSIHGGTISSSSDSDSLDVCSIDERSSSMKFIRSSVNMSKEVSSKRKSDEVLSKDRSNRDDAGKSTRKKKRCKMCCAHPCRIVEAKRINSLWGSSFPSYSVSCVSTCNVHLPGEISVYPNKTKLGYIDTCIQTTASDIKMHLNFADRFPHRAIAVASHGTQPNDAPKPELASHLKYNFVATKTEHHRTNHRTSEQKRRELLHDSFGELRKVIYTSQAMQDNERASKQWILEEATKVIASLENEAILLSALKKSLKAKNAKLKKRWAELSGKEFDPNVTWVPTEESGQTKLINLYKQYRQDVQKDNVIGEIIPTLPKVVSSEQDELGDGKPKPPSLANKLSCGLPENEKDKVESLSRPSHITSVQGSKNGSKATSMNNHSQPIVVSEGDEDIPVSKADIDLKKRRKGSQTCLGIVTSKQNEPKVANQESQAIPADKARLGLPLNIFTEAAVNAKPSQFASVVKPSQAISLDVSKPCRASSPTVSKPCQAASPTVSKPCRAASPTDSKLKLAVSPTVSKPCRAASPTDSKLKLAVSPTVSKPCRAASPTVSKPCRATSPTDSKLKLAVSPTVSKPSQAVSSTVSKPSQAVSPTVSKASQATFPTASKTVQSSPIQLIDLLAKMPYQAILPSPPVSKPNQRLVQLPVKVLSKPISPLLAVKIPSSISHLNLVNKILELNKPRHGAEGSVTGHIVALTKPINSVGLSNQSPAMVRKPTQWTAMGTLVPTVVNVTHVEDVGAVVEVGAKDQKECNDKIVLLDVAETQQNCQKAPLATTSEQARTVSLIPTSSSISVTLNSVGSITSNKMFNKKPFPSMAFPNRLPRPPKCNSLTSFSKTTPETSVSKQDIKVKNLICPTVELCDHVPKISEALLSGIDSTNEPGLCVISNVFSLSVSGENLDQCVPENAIVVNNLNSLPDAPSSAECENQDIIYLMHDHNYHKMKLLQNSETSV